MPKVAIIKSGGAFFVILFSLPSMENIGRVLAIKNLCKVLSFTCTDCPVLILFECNVNVRSCYMT